MFNSKIDKLVHIAGVAYGVSYAIVKTNIELVRIVINEFAPARNKEEAKTFDDDQDDIEYGLTYAERIAFDEAFKDELSNILKNDMSGNPIKKTED